MSVHVFACEYAFQCTACNICWSESALQFGQLIHSCCLFSIVLIKFDWIQTSDLYAIDQERGNIVFFLRTWVFTEKMLRHIMNHQKQLHRHQISFWIVILINITTFIRPLIQNEEKRVLISLFCTVIFNYSDEQRSCACANVTAIYVKIITVSNSHL